MKIKYFFGLFVLLFLSITSKTFSQNHPPFEPNRKHHRPPPMFGQGMHHKNQRPNFDITRHVITYATSSDTIHWKESGKILFKKASVPDAVIRNGIIYLYFIDVSDGHYLSVATSSDLGKTWKKQKIQISGRQSTGEAVDPNPIVLKDGRIRLFYFGDFIRNRKPNDSKGAPLHRIFSAVSKDGINFSEEKGVRFSYPDVITDPDVVLAKTHDGKEYWKMFVSHKRVNLSTTSFDGMTFTKDKNIASHNGAVSKTIAVDGGYRMFKCDRGLSTQFTKDFISWKQEGVRIAARPGKFACDPGIIQLPDKTYLMFYKTLE